MHSTGLHTGQHCTSCSQFVR